MSRERQAVNKGCLTEPAVSVSYWRGPNGEALGDPVESQWREDAAGAHTQQLPSVAGCAHSLGACVSGSGGAGGERKLLVKMQVLAAASQTGTQ